MNARDLLNSALALGSAIVVGIMFGAFLGFPHLSQVMGHTHHAAQHGQGLWSMIP